MSETVYITKRTHKADTLDSIRLLNNQILVRGIVDNLEVRTPGGLYKGAPEFRKNQFLSSYINRVHEVVNICKELTFWSPQNKLSGNSLRWKTDIEIEIGDAVWLSYPCCIEYDAVICGGVEYKIVNYGEARLVKKKDGTSKLLNGWCAYEHPKVSRSSILVDPNPSYDFTKGIITDLGKPNKAYIVNEKDWKDLDGQVDIHIGQTFVKANKAHHLLLEDPLYRFFADKDIYLILRKDILAVLDD